MYSSTYILTSSEKQKLLQLFCVRKFFRRSHLFYQGHTPHFAFVLLKGECKLIKKNKPSQSLTLGRVVGLEEIFESRPFSYSGIIQENSELLILDRTSLMEVYSSKTPKRIYAIIDRIMLGLSYG